MSTRKYKAGDKVIITNLSVAEHSIQDSWWKKNKTVLIITEKRSHDLTYKFKVKAEDGNNGIVHHLWLSLAPKSQTKPKTTKTRKYPIGAITPRQALKAAQALHPKVTHIAMTEYNDWQAFVNVKDKGGNGYLGDMVYFVSVPVKYSGDWQDSIYPEVYFSEPKEFEGVDSKIQVLEDGSLVFGSTIISPETLDAIIAHQNTEFAKFPSNKKAAK